MSDAAGASSGIVPANKLLFFLCEMVIGACCCFAFHFCAIRKVEQSHKVRQNKSYAEKGALNKKLLLHGLSE